MKSLRYTSIALILFCFCHNLPAQLMKGHQIDEQNRVTFTVTAPNAKEVKVINLSDSLAMGAPEYSMKKNEDGKWTVTTLPCREGFHYYELSIDGFRCGDPASQHYFGWARWISGLEVPSQSKDYYTPKPGIARGEVRYHYFMSAVTETYRKCIVYTPPGYDEDAGTRYPVLYLQHGAGESELGWTMQGKANVILDNLIAAGKAKPMILVMSNGYAIRPVDDPDGVGRGKDSFEVFLLEDVIPMIDNYYRTLTNPENRAIAGLSKGAGQAIRMGLIHQDIFGSVGAFSLGDQDIDPETSYGGAFRDISQFNENYNLLWLGGGTLDFFWENGLSLHQAMTRLGIKHTWDVSDYSHEWQLWRRHLHEFGQVVFK